MNLLQNVYLIKTPFKKYRIVHLLLKIIFFLKNFNIFIRKILKIFKTSTKSIFNKIPLLKKYHYIYIFPTFIPLSNKNPFILNKDSLLTIAGTLQLTLVFVIFVVVNLQFST